MSENDYVATAAAQKRLREVLTVAFKHTDDAFIDSLADALLSHAGIEYKPRAKAVLITLELPDKAVLGAALDQLAETAATSSEEAASAMPVTAPDTENVQAPPQPHIAPFAPVLDPDADYEDVHYN